MSLESSTHPERSPQSSASREGSCEIAADISRFILSADQLKQNGYQTEEFSYPELMNLRRCRRCRLRICKSPRKYHKASEDTKAIAQESEDCAVSNPEKESPAGTQNALADDGDQVKPLATEADGIAQEQEVDPKIAEINRSWTSAPLIERSEHLADLSWRERMRRRVEALENAVCRNHPGQVRGGKYTCCNQDIFKPGCAYHDRHADDDTIGQLRKDWKLHETPSHAKNPRQAIALDCEMGVNRKGELELLRVSAVDYYTGESLLDSLVWPSTLMLHLNTRFSGVSWPMLYQAKEKKTCIYGRDQARQRLWQFVGPQTIVIAHSGYSDMLALRWIHHRMIDTIEVEGRRVKPASARSLQNLSKLHLNRFIQGSRRGHDSLEDAMACRDLLKWYTSNLPESSEMLVYQEAVEEMRQWLLTLGRIEA